MLQLDSHRRWDLRPDQRDMARRQTLPPPQLPARLGLLGSILHKAQLEYARRVYQSHGPVKRISRSRAVKTTPQTLLTEALALEFIAANTTIPVPRVHKLFRDRRGYLNLVMDYVEGRELEGVWKNLSSKDRLIIIHQLRGYLRQLRALQPPRPGAVEAVDGTACKDFRIRSDPFGPFSSVPEFETFLGRNWLMENKLAEYDEFAPALWRCVSRDYRTVFTHCDLAPRNILVQGTRIVAIVDWEMAGWYPEYWEYTRAFDSNVVGTKGFWELFEQEGVAGSYPDELIAEKCLSSELVRC
ncbi:kinase-like domain-containing protein [Mycena vitilis]|nr:kinase-like domain-containing protein [Mycena vitilis]